MKFKFFVVVLSSLICNDRQFLLKEF